MNVIRNVSVCHSCIHYEEIKGHRLNLNQKLSCKRVALQKTAKKQSLRKS